MHGHVVTSAIDLPDGHAHLNGQKQGHGPCEESDHQQYSAECLQYPRDVNEIARKSMLLEELLKARVGMGELRIAVG